VTAATFKLVKKISNLYRGLCKSLQYKKPRKSLRNLVWSLLFGDVFLTFQSTHLSGVNFQLIPLLLIDHLETYQMFSCSMAPPVALAVIMIMKPGALRQLTDMLCLLPVLHYSWRWRLFIAMLVPTHMGGLAQISVITAFSIGTIKWASLINFLTSTHRISLIRKHLSMHFILQSQMSIWAANPQFHFATTRYSNTLGLRLSAFREFKATCDVQYVVHTRKWWLRMGSLLVSPAITGPTPFDHLLCQIKITPGFVYGKLLRGQPVLLDRSKAEPRFTTL